MVTRAELKRARALSTTLVDRLSEGYIALDR
jgi:hypothetical protein